MSDKNNRKHREKKDDKKDTRSSTTPTDYYGILNLKSNCSKEEIDSAYRSLAMKWHPDKNKDNKEEAEKKFRDISKAYQILSNDETRKNFDAHGISTKTENLIDPYTIFKDLFNNEDNKIPDVIVKVDATMDKLYKGFTESVNFKRFSPCKKCDCTGTRDKVDGSCPSCKGRGIILETLKGGKMGYMMNEKRCEVCEGKGLDPDIKRCKKCEGNKYIKEDIECDVDVPPGAYDNYFIKLEDEGNYIPKDERTSKSSRTNVLVVIKEIVPEDTNIRRGMFIKEINRINRADLLLSVNIGFGESLVGIKKEITYFGEKVGIEIDKVIQNGDIHVVKNMGMHLVPEELEKIKADKSHSGRGDLFIVFKVERPVLSKQQQKRLWQIVTDTAYPEFDEVDKIHESLEFDKYIGEQLILLKNKKQKKSKDVDSEEESVSESQEPSDNASDARSDDDQEDQDDRSRDTKTKKSRAVDRDDADDHDDSEAQDDEIEEDQDADDQDNQDDEPISTDHSDASDRDDDAEQDPDENFDDLIDDESSKESDHSKHKHKSSKKR